MTQNAPRSPAFIELDLKGISYQVFIHDKPITSLEQAAADRGQSPDQVIRSILFRLSSEEFCLALVAGPDQINWRELRRHFNQSRLTMASPDEVFKVTGYKPGSVSPFGLPSPLPIIADPSVFESGEISLGSGIRGTAIIMKTSDLKQALGNFEIISLIQKE